MISLLLSLVYCTIILAEEQVPIDDYKKTIHSHVLISKATNLLHHREWRTTRAKIERIRSRPRRDGGLISGSVGTAILTGIIADQETTPLTKANEEVTLLGMTARTLSEVTNFQPSQSEGGCTWFGTAPFCNWPCPSEYDFIRMHNGRCSNMWFSSFCVPDDSFGKPCSTILGGYFNKRFCCKSDPADCTWSGRWMGANTAHNIYCRYDNEGKCGSIKCSINHFTMKAHNTSEIYGNQCDRINLFGLKGKATCGYVAWFNNNDEIVDSWYKTK